MALIDLQKKFIEIKTAAESVDFSDVKLSDEFKRKYEEYILEKSPNGYSKGEWAAFSTKIITTSGKVIFLTNYWFYIASQLTEYLNSLTEQKEIFNKVFDGFNLNEVANSLRGGVNKEYQTKIKNYFSINGFSDQDYEFFEKFVSDYKSWGGGKTIDRNDYYVSPLLQAGNLLAETQSAVAEIAKQFSQEPALKKSFNIKFSSYNNFEKLKEKVDNWILSESSRGKFVYDLIKFLVNKDIQQPLFNQIVENSSGSGNYNIEYKDYRLTSFFKISEDKVSDQDIIRGEKFRFFNEPFFIDSKNYYLSNQWTDGTDSRLDIKSLIPIFNDLYSDYEILLDNGLYILKNIDIYNFIKLSKPFLLLAGISGTGKTRFVREQAKATGSLAETYCLTPVRPDWHEPSDLLGYTSRLNGKAEYITTYVLQFIAQAWRAKVDAGLSLAVNDVESHGPCLVASGDAAQLDSVLPYWLCLDEMNLAPVEQYFSDYLSILETREWLWTDNSFQYLSDPLLKASTIQQLEVAEQDKLREELGFADDHYDELWSLICEYGMGIPFNLIVAGTVNMDETTHGFSRKVIDRALSFDFGEFFPNDYAEFFEPTICNKTLSYPVLAHANYSQDQLPSIDSDGQKSIKFLNAVNAVLDNTPFKLAYRALNELLLAVISTAQEAPDLRHLQAVWDDFLMCKVLPRIEGDSDKLMTDDSQKSLLQKLNECLATELSEIWNGVKDSDNARPDLYREKLGATGDDKILRIACRSKAKLEWMQKRLERSGFTSFWP